MPTINSSSGAEHEPRPDRFNAGQISWALFDWANQPYFTLITTFIFFPYFAHQFIGDPVRGQEILGTVLAVSGVLVALSAPVLGAIADVTGPRKPWIFGFSLLFVLASTGLWWAVPGAPQGWLFIAVLIVVSSACVEAAIVFNNAMLPRLVEPARMGRLSGFGWGIGYVGGLIALFIVLIGFALPGTMSWSFLPDAPLFGLAPENFEPERMTGPFTALWYVVFVLPLFLFTPDVPSSGLTLRRAAFEGTQSLWQTVRQLGSYKNITLFLFARMIYNDGLNAIFIFGGVYASAMFEWTLTALAIFGIVLGLFAALGAFVGGHLDDRLGSKRTLMIAVSGLCFSALGAVSITGDTIFGFIAVASATADTAIFTSPAEWIYLLCGIGIGLFAGPAQAASRTFMARLAPPHLVTEFFGLYALSGKATAFLAPALIAFATGSFLDQRASLVVIIGFLILGLILLSFVKEVGPNDHKNQVAQAV